MSVVVGLRVRQIRRHRGWRQADLAECLGVDRTRVTKIEKGQIDLRVSDLLALARALNAPPHVLLTAAWDGSYSEDSARLITELENWNFFFSDTRALRAWRALVEHMFVSSDPPRYPHQDGAPETGFAHKSQTWRRAPKTRRTR